MADGGAGVGRVHVHHGDSRAVLKTLASNSIDAVVTDPPYALVSIGKRFGKPGAAAARPNGASGVYRRASSGFMGQSWDTGETAFDPEFWAQVLRVLKPGGHLVAFSATRTYHRLACAVEDGGFEIRDMLAWLYGSGFPKSHDVSKAIDKHLGHERARKPVEVKDCVRQTMKTTGFGAAEWAPQVGDAVSPEAAAWSGFGSALKPALEPVVFARKPLDGTIAQNVLKHGVGGLNVDGCRIEGNPAAWGKCSPGEGWGLNKGDHVPAASQTGRWPANVIHDGSAEVEAIFPTEAGAFAAVRGTEPSNDAGRVFGERHRVATVHHDDSGSAARFFYSAKADAGDRMGSGHPTVKPVDLMAWLCRLITPPGGVVLDPFAGSGTTGAAAIREGFGVVLIEREARFVADIERRLAWARGEGRVTALEKARLDTPAAQAKANGADLPLFGGAEPVNGGGADSLRGLRQGPRAASARSD